MLTCGANHTVNNPARCAVALIRGDGCDAVCFHRQIAGGCGTVTAERSIPSAHSKRPLAACVHSITTVGRQPAGAKAHNRENEDALTIGAGRGRDRRDTVDRIPRRASCRPAARPRAEHRGADRRRPADRGGPGAGHHRPPTERSTIGVSWAVTANLLAAVAATPLIGRLADLHSKKHVLLIVLAVVLVGSVLAATTSSLALLIVAPGTAGRLVRALPDQHRDPARRTRAGAD